jgi:hypothetical protein
MTREDDDARVEDRAEDRNRRGEYRALKKKRGVRKKSVRHRRRLA